MSEEIGNTANRKSPNDRGTETNRPSASRPTQNVSGNTGKVQNSRGRSNNRRGSYGNGPNSERMQGDSRSSAQSGNNEFSRKEGGFDRRKKNTNSDFAGNRDGGSRSGNARKSDPNRHISREIKPDEAGGRPTAGNRSVRDGRDGQENRDNRDNRDHRSRQNHSDNESRGGRADRRYDRRPEPKNWSRNIRSEETSEEIRKDNERIEKDIWLEIAGIHTMKLD